MESPLLRNACEIIECVQAADADGTFRRNEMYTVGGVIWFKDAIKQHGFIGHDVLSGCWDELRREGDEGGLERVASLLLSVDCHFRR